MSVAMVLVLIAAGLAAVGLGLAIWGFSIAPDEPQGLGAVEQPSLIGLIIELLRKLFTYMFGKSPRWKRIASFGVFLILLAIGFLLSAGIAVLVGGGSDGGDGDGDPGNKPSPSSSSSPTPSN